MEASIANIENRSFSKAILATIASALAFVISSYVFSAVLRTGTLFDWILAFIIYILVVQRLFSTNFGKALVAVIIAWIIGLIIAVVGWSIVGLSVGNLM